MSAQNDLRTQLDEALAAEESVFVLRLADDGRVTLTGLGNTSHFALAAHQLLKRAQPLAKDRLASHPCDACARALRQIDAMLAAYERGGLNG